MGMVDVRASCSAMARSILRPVAGDGAAVWLALGVGVEMVRLERPGPCGPWLARLPVTAAWKHLSCGYVSILSSA